MSDDPRLDEIKDTLKRGMLARLNSGGPTMTIMDVHPDGIIETTWFTEGGEIRSSGFHHLELTFPGSRIAPIERFRPTAAQGSWSA
jgi:uncharacterized protein YodC (DUF2158 family)